MGAIIHPTPKRGQKRVQFCYFSHEKNHSFLNLYLYPCKDNGYKDRNGMLGSKWLNRDNIGFARKASAIETVQY
ncbi:hypothetical protein QF042_001626 [Pedobacter sp. W3I1]|nr:hypothetical protein [Pedobacter sp. W3I1]